jgi:hypothetical protein
MQKKAAVEMVVAVPPLRLPAVDHPVVEQIEVARALPDLRMHDDRAVEPRHFVRGWGADGAGEFVMPRDHVEPPRVLEIALERHAERAVVPEAVETAVDLARLEDEAAALGERHDPVHPRLLVLFVHESRTTPGNRGPDRTPIVSLPAAG